MRYAQVVPFEVCNGIGIGTSLFVQGCDLRCRNCFNPESWEFDGGKEWTDEVHKKFIDAVSRDYIKRVSFLGGEPLTQENVQDVVQLMREIKHEFPDKDIWLYTGYQFESLFSSLPWLVNTRLLNLCDVIVDGKYIEELKDITLKWRGSSNQRVIDVQKTLQQGEIALYNN